MRDRLELIHRLLAADGTLFVHIDDNELGYLTVLCDEIFGRPNRTSLVTFKQGAATGHKAINPGCVSTANYILIYAKNKDLWAPNRLFTARERDDRYNQFIPNVDDAHSAWEIVSLTKAYSEHASLSEKDARARIRSNPEEIDEFVASHAEHVIRLARPDYKAVSKEARALIDESKKKPDEVLHLPREDHKDFYFIRGERILFYKHKLKEIDGQLVAGEPLTTIWDDLLSNNLHNEGEFGGSGTTGWKGGRRWNFRFFKLAPSLLEKDKWGNWIVSKQYKPEMLAEAMCKLEGFRYAPDREVFWNHGHSTERDFIYVTTQNLSPDQLRFISEQVGPERTLLICCGAFRGKPSFPNLTVKKIPQAVLARCEWGRDDYSLNVTEQAPVVAVEEAKAEASSNNGTKRPRPAGAARSRRRCKHSRCSPGSTTGARMTSRHVNSITGRLSLRSPQRRSLEILDRVMEIAQPHKGGDLKAALDIIRSEFPSVEDFEHAFPSLCFALATGVGKTRLMGAFITYLHLEYGIRHFFVLAPNLTIYNKLLADFTPNTPKYVFQGIAEFAVKAPTLVTGENFEQKPQVLDLFERDDVVVNIFNISKFNEKAKGTDERARRR
jgi:adenine-specific DNA-methyltransferase